MLRLARYQTNVCRSFPLLVEKGGTLIERYVQINCLFSNMPTSNID